MAQGVYAGRAPKRSCEGETVWDQDFVKECMPLVEEALKRADKARADAWHSTIPDTPSPDLGKLELVQGKLSMSCTGSAVVFHRGGQQVEARERNVLHIFNVLGNQPELILAALEGLEKFIAWCETAAEERKTAADALVAEQTESIRALRAKVVARRLAGEESE